MSALPIDGTARVAYLGRMKPVKVDVAVGGGA